MPSDAFPGANAPKPVAEDVATPVSSTLEEENEKVVSLEGGKEIKVKKVADGEYEIVSENFTDDNDEDLGVSIDSEGKEAPVGFENLSVEGGISDAELLREYCGVTTDVRVGDVKLSFSYKNDVKDWGSKICTIKAPSMEAVAEALKKLPLTSYDHERI